MKADERGIPGFDVIDRHGRVVASDPTKGERRHGRRTEDKPRQYHSYPLKVRKGIWIAFARKCEQNDLKYSRAITLMMKAWVLGEFELDLTEE